VRPEKIEVGFVDEHKLSVNRRAKFGANLLAAPKFQWDYWDWQYNSTRGQTLLAG